MGSPDTTPPGPARFLASAGPVAACVLVIGTAAATMTWQGFDHSVQPLSDLGGTAAPAPVIQNVTFVVFGAGVVALGVALSARVGRSVAALVVGCGTAMAALSLLACSPGCAAGTATDVAHGIIAVLGFVAVAVAMLLIGRRDPVGSPRWGRASTVAGAVTLALLVAWLVAAQVDPVGWRAGLLQRFMVGTVLVWLVVVSRHLHRRAPAPGVEHRGL